MAKLTTKARKKLPSKTFGLPRQRKYPMPDRRHAGLAKSYAKQEEEKGKLSEAAYRHIVAMANKKLG